jgi:hypothetical protein
MVFHYCSVQTHCLLEYDCLTENGRNRSNSRQLSEILFFCEAKASAHVRTVQMEADLLLKIFFMSLPMVDNTV